MDCRARARPHYRTAAGCVPVCDGAFLQLKLPSGRKLSYPQPRITGDEHEQPVVFADNGAGQLKDCRTAKALTVVYGLRTLSAALPAICWLTPCCGSRPPAIRSCCMCTMRLVAEVPEGFGSTEDLPD